MKTVIMTDSCCDLPLSFVKENNIDVISLGINIDSKYYSDDLGQSINIKEFYDKLRSGIMPTTSQANAFSYEERFKKHVEEGKAVIYIGFSSALSGSVNSARIAMENVKDEYDKADITIIDSKSASLGLGLLVYKAVEMLKQGASKDEIVSWVEDNKLKLNHWFTVDDLNHLKRGGRVSGTVAAVGTLLGIKPVLHVDNEGRLVPVSKVKGRKKSIKVLQETIKERIVNPEEQVIFISHGDCLEEAEYLRRLITDEVKVKDVIINNVGPTIGTHSGPGTIALFFLGKER
ncbi:DegV family protein [Clostridium isatidis]|uniref:Fatty acid-binding protein DegV n=1 Tax=Clostridium isatidis TaxID=182773 RepID=A0A343JAI8_9CLOT|nr:DegV family protein [Clostridium isatidis]ASW42546.1 fatty acid-binding protein DegV [Clostridium isatidis]NLZ33752.1 DegV family protein [Clostridiales bacterium]